MAPKWFQTTPNPWRFRPSEADNFNVFITSLYEAREKDAR
jgi:hypothetical protein